ncbi:DUF4251 domain-containing protein [Pedobacter cryophilus]|uniref:DUF4251 domain-containing protein n=1 Tax=Pedobacter cryophilus TaxID=2571271 RepID=A0A4U1BV64_9SPHI|nr:DUF4251 domain-containing protein [Pedobacter cryophilus]TKB96014.1 DUF4251 domain-containing protein [Pedobacter cryophilus]
MKNISKILFLAFLSTFLLSCLTQKEKEENKSEITKILKANSFKFIAQQALPMRMTAVQLTSEYTLTVSPDSINCFLPYFGVATQAPYGGTNNAIEFITTDFTYDKKSNTDGSYEITIIPKKTDKATRLYLNISASGYASLNVSSNYRDPINFNGVIVKR